MDTQTEYVHVHKEAADRWLEITLAVVRHLGPRQVTAPVVIWDFIEDAVRDAIQAESQQVRELDKLDMEV